MRPRSGIWAFLGKFALSVAAFALVLHAADISGIWRRWQTVQPNMLLVALIPLGGQFVLSGWRWQYILRRLRLTVPLAKLLDSIGASYLYGQLLPASIGGDVLRIAMISRSVGLPKATLSVVLDRLSGLTALIALAVITVPVAGLSVGISSRAIIYAGLTFIIAVIALFAWSRLRRRSLLAGFMQGLAGDLARFSDGPWTVATLLSLSVIMHLASILVFYALAVAIDVPVDLRTCLLLLPAALLVSSLPVSLAGWGVREGAVAAGFSFVGLAPEDALATSVLYGLTSPVIGLAVVVLRLATEQSVTRLGLK